MLILFDLPPFMKIYVTEFVTEIWWCDDKTYNFNQYARTTPKMLRMNSIAMSCPRRYGQIATSIALMGRSRLKYQCNIVKKEGCQLSICCLSLQCGGFHAANHSITTHYQNTATSASNRPFTTYCNSFLLILGQFNWITRLL